MSIMQVERLNEWDGADGSLKAAGVTWVEQTFALKILAWLVIMGCVAWLVFFLAISPSSFLAVSPYSGPSPWKGIPLALAAYLLASVFTKHRRRVFMFGHDGGMAMPFGLSPYARRVRALGGHHHDAIQSIELKDSRHQPQTYDVQMFDGSGNIFPIARALIYEDAFKLTVQLNNALAFMREENARREEEAMSWVA